MSKYNLSGILSGPIDGKERMDAEWPSLEARTGLTVLHRSSKFRGSVVRVEHDGTVVLRSKSSGLERIFRMVPGAFAFNGETVTLVRPAVSKKAPARTASGSVMPTSTAARVAKASRILVEGLHDAELVEKVWGDDLRVEGIVVERLDGIDDLPDVIESLQPTASARLGVLVDHLVAGSKESRLVTTISSPHVRITGTPYVDVWQAIRPTTVGIAAWPSIARDRQWKVGICEFFGVAEPGALWKQLLGEVTSYADLEPELVGAVESLIDFVTAGD